MSVRMVAAALLASVSLAACGIAPGVASPTPAVSASTSASNQQLAASEARVLGILAFQNEATQDVLAAPDTVQAGAEFQITISTFGGGCERAGDTAVLYTNAGASVMVYDFTSATGPNVACTQILKRLLHIATLRFTQPGEGLIRVWGRRLSSDTLPAGEPIVLERRVVVQ